MEIEIVAFVVKGSAKLTVPTDWQEQIQVRSRSVALRRVFDLKLRGIHLTEIILKVWVINRQNVVDVSICEGHTLYIVVKPCKHDTDFTIQAGTVKLGTQITYNKITTPIDFQGHGSKVKVTRYTLLTL